MKNIILGDGITGYIIAACLNYNNEKFEIIGDGNYTPPSILVLKYKTTEELTEYFNIFEIEMNEKNIAYYTKAIKVGYTLDFKTIYDKPTEEMKKAYLEKQHRAYTSSAMSDDLNMFMAIDLKKVYEHLKKKYEKYTTYKTIKKEDYENLKDCTIYNTIFATICNDYKPEVEYIFLTETNLDDYDYIYDCNRNSRIKRMTSEYVEYISNPGYYDFEIKNFYNEPRIYTITKPKDNFTWIDAGRNVTHTQVKQEDIIKFIVKYE